MPPKTATLSILFGALCMSFAALFVRLIENADGYQILFYPWLSHNARLSC